MTFAHQPGKAPFHARSPLRVGPLKFVGLSLSSRGREQRVLWVHVEWPKCLALIGKSAQHAARASRSTASVGVARAFGEPGQIFGCRSLIKVSEAESDERFATEIE